MAARGRCIRSPAGTWPPSLRHTSVVPSPAPCDCPGCPNVFSTKEAEGDLRRYRRKGPDPTTKALLAAIVQRGVEGARVLDIGGGIGAIQLELLAAGAGSAVAVDASPEYVAVARAEAGRRGFGDRITHLTGDFVTLASALDPADVVTLDRVVCCYSDMPGLLRHSVEHAQRMIGLVYPCDRWWIRWVARVMNALSRLTRSPTRWYLHPARAIDGLIRDAGFEAQPIKRGLLWEVVLYVRRTTPGAELAPVTG